MKSIAEKEFNRTSKKFYEWTNKARSAAENYLKEVVEQQPNQHIEFDFNEYDDENISIIYYGEYASNVCSNVYAVYMDKNTQEILLNIEDTTMYGIDRVDTLDLLTVCEAVQCHLSNTK